MLSRGQRIRDFIKEWIVPAGAVIVVLAAMFAGSRYILNAELSGLTHDVETIQRDLATANNEIGKSNARIDKTNDKIDHLLEQTFQRLLPGNGGIPKKDLKGRVEASSQLIEMAKAEGIRLNPILISAHGKRIMDVSEKYPGVWPVAEQLLSYRTFLNAELPQLPENLKLTTKRSEYRESVTLVLDPKHPEWHAPFEVLYAGGYTTPEKSARLERLDNPQPGASGLAFFVIDGLSTDTIVLDGEYMKNVIIRNANVSYRGGPVVLENVYFVNCTFSSFRPTPNSRQLGKALFASVSTTFKTDQKVSRLKTPDILLRGETGTQAERSEPTMSTLKRYVKV